MSGVINDGGPAFPFMRENGNEHIPLALCGSGMSLRAWLAGQALCGLLADTNNIGSPSQNAKASVMSADATITALMDESESHNEISARIMQLESVIDQAKSAMVTHVGLCAHYNLDYSDLRCDGCQSFSDRTCPIRMFLAGVNHPNAWEPVL